MFHSHADILFSICVLQLEGLKHQYEEQVDTLREKLESERAGQAESAPKDGAGGSGSAGGSGGPKTAWGDESEKPKDSEEPKEKPKQVNA